MATFLFGGLEEYARKLSDLALKSREVGAQALYAGAKILADQIRRNLEAVPTIPNTSAHEEYTNGVPEEQKQALLDSFGITQIRDDDGYLNLKMGFDGYNGIKTRMYPKGQPNVMIAASVESGSSVQQKYPFVRPAIKQKEKECIDAIAAVIDKETAQIMK